MQWNRMECTYTFRIGKLSVQNSLTTLFLWFLQGMALTIHAYMLYSFGLLLINERKLGFLRSFQVCILSTCPIFLLKWKAWKNLLKKKKIQKTTLQKEMSIIFSSWNFSWCSGSLWYYHHNYLSTDLLVFAFTKITSLFWTVMPEFNFLFSRSFIHRYTIWSRHKPKCFSNWEQGTKWPYQLLVVLVATSKWGHNMLQTYVVLHP